VPAEPYPPVVERVESCRQQGGCTQPSAMLPGAASGHEAVSVSYPATDLGLLAGWSKAVGSGIDPAATLVSCYHDLDAGLRTLMRAI
jgi:hypothetical protein